MLFDLYETEVLIPAEKIQKFCEDNNLPGMEYTPVNMSGYKGKVVAYPLPWAQNFGSEFYQHVQASPSSGIDNNGLWDVAVRGDPYYGNEPQPRPKEHIEQNLKSLLEELQKEN